MRFIRSVVTDHSLEKRSNDHNILVLTMPRAFHKNHERNFNQEQENIKWQVLEQKKTNSLLRYSRVNTKVNRWKTYESKNAANSNETSVNPCDYIDKRANSNRKHNQPVDTGINKSFESNHCVGFGFHPPIFTFNYSTHVFGSRLQNVGLIFIKTVRISEPVHSWVLQKYYNI